MNAPAPTAWQRQVLAELRAAVDAYPDDVSVLGGPRMDSTGQMQLRLRLRTADIPREHGGLPLEAFEDVAISVPLTELAPPRVEVDHDRFVGYPHVLQGRRLCLYLDPSREWDPSTGFYGFLDRLIGWFTDAASARFDAQTALYHAVGGVVHATAHAPTVVVRDPLRAGRRAQHGWLLARSPHRLDLTFTRPAIETSGDHTPVILLDADLPLGAGSSLGELLYLIDGSAAGEPHPGSPFAQRAVSPPQSSTVLSVLGASAIRKADSQPQRLVLAVPHPTGGPAHLLAANIPAPGADHLRACVRATRTKGSPTIDIDRTDIDPDTPLDWWPLSDERAEVTTRRDIGRPMSAFAGKKVAIWGCGGLGSWVAEYIVRAGAEEIQLCDPGSITGGLLVRQNFVELDVGDSKVASLARRLRAISDTARITTHEEMIPPPEAFFEADLIIDATVSVAISRFLDEMAARPRARPTLAQIATDSRTGTLGLLTVATPSSTIGPLTIDRLAGKVVCADGALEAFHCLWDADEPDSPIIPTRGCSTPTFHGSAADLAAVAASLTNMLGVHLHGGTGLSGTHLISLPHGEAGPHRTFIPAQTDSVQESRSSDCAVEGGAASA